MLLKPVTRFRIKFVISETFQCLIDKLYEIK
jgi:hypothetical protein